MHVINTSSHILAKHSIYDRTFINLCELLYLTRNLYMIRIRCITRSPHSMYPLPASARCGILHFQRHVYTVSVGSHSSVRHRVSSLQPQATTDEAVRHCWTAACLLYPHGQHIPCVLFSSFLGFLLSSGCFWCLDLLVETPRITNNDASCTSLFYHEQQQQ